MDSLDTEKPERLTGLPTAPPIEPYLQLPATICAVRDTARDQVQRCLSHLFTQCQPLFQSLARSARNNNEQEELFSAPGIVRQQRKAIQGRFIQHFERGFIALESNSKPLEKRPLAHAAELDLVDDTAMDYTVALTKMVSRAREDNRAELFALERRLEAALNSIAIDEHNNPLDPEQLGAAFHSAIEPLELSSMAKVALFRQFDKLLSRQLPEIYFAVNEQLIEAGVLPEVSYQLRRDAENEALPTNTRSTSTTTAKSPDSSPRDQHPQVEPPMLTTGISPAGKVMEFTRNFSELSELLDQVRNNSAGGNPGFPIFTSPGTGPAMAPEELRTLLSDLQRDAHSKSQTAELWQPPPDLRSLLSRELEKRQESGNKSKLDKADEDVINLIAMFFDFVLDDKQLPLQVQALISRLQIPLLKIALRDKSFFSSAKHPLRRLINEIVAAGIGLNDRDAQKRDSFVEQLTDVVHDVQANYEDDPNVFVRNLELLQRLRHNEEKRAQKVARRSGEAAAAEAKTQHSKALVEQLVLERLIDIEVPQVVQNFAIGEWQQVLLLARLKHGNESAEWLEALQTLDDLIWSSLHHEDEKSVLRLRQMLPELQTRLLNLLSRSKPSEADATACLQDVIDLQSKLLSEDPASVQRESLDDQLQRALNREDLDEDKPWREMTAVERQQMQYRALTYEFIKQADQMPVGSWLVFTRPNGSSVRCRLAARLNPNESLVFVDRFGFKTLLKNRREFAQELQDGTAKRVVQERFFDRIMNKVSDQLHSRSAAVPNSYEPA